MRAKFRVRRNSGSDRDRLPITADELSAALGTAHLLADGWATTMLVERWDADRGFWVTEETVRPEAMKVAP